MSIHFLPKGPAVENAGFAHFALFECGTRKVHIDAHVEVAGAFYPVPLRLTGESVQVRWTEHLVRVFHDDMEVAVHARVEPGHWALRPGHAAAELTSTQQSHLQWLKRRCGEIGPELRQWAEAAHQARGIRTFKLLQGVLSLAKKHTRAQMLHAASSALEQHRFRYEAFKHLAEAPITPPERELIAEHPVIRPMSQYSLTELFTLACLPESFLEQTD